MAETPAKGPLHSASSGPKGKTDPLANVPDSSPDGPVQTDHNPPDRYEGIALPADIDPKVPQGPVNREEKMYKDIEKRRADGAELYNFHTFFQGGSKTKRIRHDEMHAMADRITNDPSLTNYGTHTADQIAVEVLHKAGILSMYPDLVIPFADLLVREVLSKQEERLGDQFRPGPKDKDK